MTVAIYPGSFNPFHDGHLHVVKQALQVFDHVIVAHGVNPEKCGVEKLEDMRSIEARLPVGVEYMSYKGLLVNFMKTLEFPASAIIRGIRSAHDFESERIQQYWNEDLGIEIPTFYIIADRNLVHISSSAIRLCEKARQP